MFRVKHSVLLGWLDSEDSGTEYRYETIYHWKQHNNPEDLNMPALGYIQCSCFCHDSYLGNCKW